MAWSPPSSTTDRGGADPRTQHQSHAVLGLFLDAGAAAGDLRPDIDAADLAATLAGVLTAAGAPEQRAQAERMLNLVLDGLRPG